ncbi:MAG: acyltransferase family protein [Chloroflexaceae bacterium]|jgi:peptidoglycan/LPS O-acetylase OafA/YrhL|nr:acyltransferase family protein [Chloroflexaceae bacterium]
MTSQLHTSSANDSGRIGYIPGLDGLRALAVLAVLLYHAELPWMTGGFIGVEVFFVVSGYLITALLLAEWQSRDAISLGQFWLRRARRLLPATLALVGVTMTVAVVWLPNEVAGLRGEAVAALGYATNWYLIFHQQSYFESVGRPSLLQHLWSLAVEEQFYLLWPPLLLLALRRWRPLHVAWLALAGAAASTMWMASLYQPDLDPSRIYYGTDTRAAGFLIGAALALSWRRTHSRPDRAAWLDGAGLVALGGLVFISVLASEYDGWLYLGGFGLVALLSAVVIVATTHYATRLVPGLLGLAPLRWLGLRSYSLYLWHWPVFMLTRPQLDLPLEGWPLLVLRLGLSLLLAEISYRWIETPFRQGLLGHMWQGWRSPCSQQRRRATMRLASGGATLLFVAGGLTFTVAAAQPPAPPAYLTVSLTATPTVTAIPPTATATARPQLQPPPDPTDMPNWTPVPLPTPSPTPIPQPRVLAIGDSVMRGAAQVLANTIGNVTIDTVVGRQAKATIAVAQAYRNQGLLGDVVIVHVGNNGPISSEQFDQLMAVLHDVPRVIVVNAKVPRRWEASNNAVLAEGVGRYPNAVLVNWHGASSARPELFWDDGMHLRADGAQLYATLLAEAMR